MSEDKAEYKVKRGATVEPQPDTALAVRTDGGGQVDAYALIMRAVSDPACDPAKLRELLQVRREWNADEAAAAFNAAVVMFQQRCAIVPKGDDAHGRAYARIDRIWRTIRPLMEECGLAVTWESVKASGEVCVLDGHLRHSRGHAQPLHHEMPFPDKISGQNATQRAGSGETYCKRYATCAALGVQTGKDDDDGNGGEAQGCPVTAEHAATLKDMIRKADRDEASVCAWAGVGRIEDLPQNKATVLETMLRKAIAARERAGGK